LLRSNRIAVSGTAQSLNILSRFNETSSKRSQTADIPPSTCDLRDNGFIRNRSYTFSSSSYPATALTSMDDLSDGDVNGNEEKSKTNLFINEYKVPVKHPRSPFGNRVNDLMIRETGCQF